MNCLCLVVSLLAAASPPAHSDQPLRVAAAISLREALTSVATGFEEHHKIKIELVFGSSGQLLAQIRNGAKVDVFISAANEQVGTLEREGLTLADTRRVIATNRLVLVVRPGDAAAPARFQDLATPAVRRLAIGEPAIVPAGQYATEVLKKLELDAQLKDRLVYGTNVRQVLDYVERGEVTAGIVYATDAKLSGHKVRVAAVAEPGWHRPIEYPAVVIKTSRRPEQAKAFLRFLLHEESRAIFIAKGFGAPPAPATKPPPPEKAPADPPGGERP